MSLAILSHTWHRNAGFSLLTQNSSAEEKAHSVDQKAKVEFCKK